ncbi:hypothetical protein ACJ41O_004750 [Fusarium nematophilum]
MAQPDPRDQRVAVIGLAVG